MSAADSPLPELADTMLAAFNCSLTVELDLPDGGRLQFYFMGYHDNGRWCGNVWHVLTSKAAVTQSAVTSARPDDALRALAAQYPEAVFRRDAIWLSHPDGKSAETKLKPVVIRALCEAFGRPIPSMKDLANEQKATKAAKKTAAGDTLDLLKSGPAGVKAFNERPDQERVLDLRKADLSGCDLSGIKLEFGTRLDEARLAGARLTRAILWSCKAAGVDFSGADLTGAELHHAALRGAIFTGANLTDANLSGADLRGVDFTGATLTGCGFDFRAKFDEQTKWPSGSMPPKDVAWKGTGIDPRLIPTGTKPSRRKPTDFAGFLKRLEQVTDQAKLAKALEMLQADRFQLFAKVDSDHVAGVVKSQSDDTLVYSCRLGHDGKYACCTQNLNVCGGLRGSPCKHLLVLLVGLTRAGELEPAKAHDWIQASRGEKPKLDKDAMTETLLRYKGAEAGEVDWRPTETIPEDFYAL
jgi:hypothetical protein